ncbi:MAG: hypothetical protein ACLUOI_14835 [Eisenbergiella sp.]
MQLPEVSALIPARGSRQLHPPFLFPGGCRSAGLSGESGLAGALASMHAAGEIEDDGRKWMPITGRSAGARRSESLPGISGELCREFYDEVALPENKGPLPAVRSWRHGWRKRRCAPGLISSCAGAPVTFMICRLTPDHEKAVETFLKARYRAWRRPPARTEDLWGAGNRLQGRSSGLPCRQADPEDRRVTLEQRYQKRLKNGR